MDTDKEMILLEQKANDAAAIAAARGYRLPDEYAAARAIEREAAHALNTPPPAVAYPAKPTAVAKWVADTAKARADWREARTVAAELHAYANRLALRVAFDEAPAYVAKVVDDFADHADDFRRLAGAAPRSVHGHTTTEDFELHAELLRAVDDLTADVSHRARLALLTDEGQDIGGDLVWLVIDPAGDTSLEAVHAVLSSMRGRLPATADEWEQIGRIGMGMARQGEVASRKERFSKAVYAGGQMPDGGMHDKTIDEALRSAAP